MPIVGDVTGAGEVASAGATLVKTISDVIFRFFPDKEKAAEAAQALQMEVLTQQGQMNHDQSEINKVEAASPQLFVAGWRPALGWVCAAGFAYAFVVGPMVAMVIRVFKAEYVLPVLDTGSLIALVTSMLGLAGARTWEKVQGIEPPSAAIVTTKQVVKRALPVE